MRQQNPCSQPTIPFYLLLPKSTHDEANPVPALEQHHPHLPPHLHFPKQLHDDLVAVTCLRNGPLAVSDVGGCLRMKIQSLFWVLWSASCHNMQTTQRYGKGKSKKKSWESLQALQARGSW